MKKTTYKLVSRECSSMGLRGAELLPPQAKKMREGTSYQNQEGQRLPGEALTN